jgi:DNA-directed RNA polymerase subunit RPC12/RpoP
MTKKRKPYITCDPCGIQLFVRGPAGISGLNRLIENGRNQDLWTTLKELNPHYHLKCPKCGCRFWIRPELVKTSLFDGRLQGFRWHDRRMGGEMTRVTVVGAILIVALALFILVAIQALTKGNNPDQKKSEL